MNTLKRLVSTGLSFKEALFKIDNMLNLETRKRIISSLNKNLKLINDQTSNINIETRLNVDSIEISMTMNQISVKKAYPYIWLRDNCKCSKCFNYLADEVERDLLGLDENVKPLTFQSKSDSNLVEITWSDGHKSEYNLIELSKYAFSHHEGVVSQVRNCNSSPVLWNRESITKQGGLRVFNYKDYMNDEAALRECIIALKQHGAALIEGVAAEQSEIKKVSNRIGPIQNSFFGGGECVVTNNLEFVDRAYTSMSLKAHTDNAYMNNTAGLELFHVTKKPEIGGESVLVDGFYCANLLKETNLEDFEFLTKIKVESQYYKKDVYNIKHMDHVIKLNPINGDLFQIRYNPYHKVNLTHLSHDEIGRYYKAIKNLAKIIENKQNELWIGLKPSQILIFDNFRLLHGRSGFKGHRELITSYISRDDWLSKSEVLLE